MLYRLTQTASILVLTDLVPSIYKHPFQPLLPHHMHLRVRDQRLPLQPALTASRTFHTFGASGYTLGILNVLIRSFRGRPLMELE